jgi:hypothetical protein
LNEVLMVNRFGFNLGDYNPEELKKNDGFQDIVPQKMREAKRWLLWRSEKDKHNSSVSRKIPYYADGTHRRGTLDTEDDLQRLVTYDVAVQSMSEGGFSGLGFALGRDGEGYWQGIDLDDIKEHKNDSLAERLPGYVELSPSGDGVHAIGYGGYFRGKNRSGEQGWEYYSRAKYFTFTGNVFRNGEIVDLKPFIKKYIDKDMSEDTSENKASLGHLILSESQVEDIERALKYIDSDCPRDTWLQVGFSLARVPDGFRLFSEWSKRSQGALHSVATDADIEDQWNDIHTNSRGEITLGTLYYYAEKNPEYSKTEVGEKLIEEITSNKKKDEFIKKLEIVRHVSDYLYEPDWIIDGFLGEGVNYIAGAEGKGKSSLLVPLALQVSKLTHPTFLNIRHRRKVLYLSEDINQLSQIVFGMQNHHSNASDAEINHWFNKIPAFKMTTSELRYFAEFTEDFSVEQDGKMIPPLVIFDTASSTFHLENEDSNTEAAELMNLIRIEYFMKRNIAVIVTGHMAKTLANVSEVQDLSARGAGAWGGNAQGTGFIIEDPSVEGRILLTKKRRFTETMTEVRSVMSRHFTKSKNRYGEVFEGSPYHSFELVPSDLTSRINIKNEAKSDSLKLKIIAFVNDCMNGESGYCTYSDLSNSKVVGDKNKFPELFREMEKSGMLQKVSPTDYEVADLQVDRRVKLVKTLGNWRNI